MSQSYLRKLSCYGSVGLPLRTSGSVRTNTDFLLGSQQKQLITLLRPSSKMVSITICAHLAFFWISRVPLATLIKRSRLAYLNFLVKSFLENGKVIFLHQGSELIAEVPLGCPQSSVLSSFLWNILVDDVLCISFPFRNKVIACADDLTLITSHNDPVVVTQQLQTACDAVKQWLAGVKLNINARKSIFMLFSKRTCSYRFRLRLCVNGSAITPVTKANFLCFVLDPQPKWKEHVTQKCAFVKKILFHVQGCLRCTWGFDRSKLRFLYLTAVEPIVSYGCLVWDKALRQKNL